MKTTSRKPAIFATPAGGENLSQTAADTIWNAFSFGTSPEAEDGPFYCSYAPSFPHPIENNFDGSGATVPPTSKEKNLIRIGAHLWANIRADEELSTQIARELRKMAKAMNAKAAAVLRDARELDTPQRRRRRSESVGI